MKSAVGLKLINLALLTISIALLTTGIIKQTRRTMQIRHEATVYQLNAAHDHIARHYALRQTAKLP